MALYISYLNKRYGIYLNQPIIHPLASLDFASEPRVYYWWTKISAEYWLRYLTPTLVKKLCSLFTLVLLSGGRKFSVTCSFLKDSLYS